MSTNDDTKAKGGIEPDWDSAVEEWEQVTKDPTPAEDKTPSPRGETEATTNMQDKSDAPKQQEPAEESVAELFNDSTVVAAVPEDLLASSQREAPEAAGLGQLLGKGRDAPSAVEEEVFTSAPDLGKHLRPASVPPAPESKSARHADDEVLDPFADLREKSSPQALSPRPPAPRATPPLRAPGIVSLEEIDGPPSAPESQPGPKLLEPESRRFSSDDETGVMRHEELGLDEIRKSAESGEMPAFAPPPPPASQSHPETIEPEPAPRAKAPPPPPPIARPAPPAAPEPSPPAVAPPRLSMAPAPLEPRLPQWPDERDCAAHLLDAGVRDAWSERTAWLAEEAEACAEPSIKASMLMAISEMHAMLGDEEPSEAAALKAQELSPNHPLAQRQVRAARLRDRQWPEMLPSLEAEIRVAPTPDAKVHGLLLQAEIVSRVQGDPQAADKLLDLAARIAPSDPRAHVEKFVRGLNVAPDTAPKAHVPDELEGLGNAFKDVLRIRLADKGGATEQVGPYEAIPLTRAALLAFDTVTASRTIRGLDPVRGMGPGAAWLSAALAGQRSASRADSALAFTELAAGSHGGLARRLAAVRAVESGDASALDVALAHPGSESFSATDRSVLASLFGREAASARSFNELVHDKPSTSPLGAGALAALEPVTGQGAELRVDAVVGDGAMRSVLSAARAVLGAADDAAFATRVLAWRERGNESTVARMLQLEADVAAGKTDVLVEALGSWAAAGADAERDRALAAGLVAEVVGNKTRARSEYERASEADPSSESCARALATFDSEGLPTRLAEIAKASSDDTRAAVLLLEAAVRNGPDGDDYAVWLRRAHELAPGLAIPSFLGERHARTQGDVDGVLEWLRLRREASEDPMEAAYDLTREAMLTVERDASLAASLLERASSARPQDVALRELYERFSSEKPADWITWRVERSAESTGPDKARLLLEAALEHERVGAADEASRLSRQAADEGAGGLARLCAERAELAGAQSTSTADLLMGQARSETNSLRERREAKERLAELDEFGRGDMSSALLWHRAILEEVPSHLPSLRKLEQAYISEGREDELEPIAAELARALQGAESEAHAIVASRLRVREASWSSTRDLADAAASQPHPSLWALREALSHAHAAADHAAVLKAATALAERADRDADAAALLACAAEAQAHLGEPRAAVDLLVTALAREPKLVQAHLRLIDLLREAGDPSRAAEEAETLARKSAVPEHRLTLWHRAAVLWLDDVKDVARGSAALQEASDIDIAYADVFPRLQAIYTEASDRTELAALLERRLEVITDPQERVEMEVLRGKALAEVGETTAAKQALAAALDASPDHVPALQAFARLCADEQDWPGAEQSLIRLARHVPEPNEQAAIYRQLGEIYIDHLPNWDRAELVLLEVLKRCPEDADVQKRLIEVYRETGNGEKAVELCASLLQRASTPELKRSATIQLALIHEQVQGDVKKAETMLEKTYKEAPTSVESLRALAEFHSRHNHQPALKVLLDRAANDARRSLGTGRFNTDLFAVLATVGELRNNPDAALVAQAAHAALEGAPVEIGAGGAAVFKTDLDELIAPPILSDSFRALLSKLGDTLDNAFPLDLKALRSGKFPPTAQQLEQAIMNSAEVFGLSGLQAFVSPALGPTCIPVSSNPPRIVLGASLVAASEEDVRDFLILRALKILQTNGSVLSRTAPIDLLPLVTALIKSLAPAWSHGAVDQKRFEDARAKLAQHLPKTLLPEVGALATEVSGQIDNRISTLNVAINSWGSRAALLASGSLLGALKGIAWAGGHPSGPPASGQERITWIGRNAEARELVVFAVSDAFLEARRRLGIAQE